MTKGLLILEEQLPNQLVFICPGCHKEHSIFVTIGATYEHEFTHVWHYKTINSTIDRETQNIALSPSFNAEEVCGYHGPFNWEVNVMVIQANQARDEITENWLKSSE